MFDILEYLIKNNLFKKWNKFNMVNFYAFLQIKVEFYLVINM